MEPGGGGEYRAEPGGAECGERGSGPSALGVARGVRWGTVLGILASVWIGLIVDTVLGLTTGLAVVLALTHLLLWPAQALLTGGLWLLARFVPDRVALAWRLAPVRWDEVILLPLPGLVGLLLLLHQSDAAQGQAALADVETHRFRWRAAREARARLGEK